MAAELAPPSRWGYPLEGGRRRPPEQSLDCLSTSSDCFLGLDMVLGVGLDLEQQPEEDGWGAK